jgi:hypothetical protein
LQFLALALWDSPFAVLVALRPLKLHDGMAFLLSQCLENEWMASLVVLEILLFHSTDKSDWTDFIDIYSGAGLGV